MGNASFAIVTQPGGIRMGCVTCRKAYLQTKNELAIRISIEEPSGTYNYLLGNQEKFVCCGEEKAVLHTFANKGDAMAEIIRLRVHMNKHGSTKGIQLLSFTHLKRH